jgi:class 3 adenylate cyclase
MVEQPLGTVTLVFTDTEGSTRLIAELGQDRYRDVLAAHKLCSEQERLLHAERNVPRAFVEPAREANA